MEDLEFWIERQDLKALEEDFINAHRDAGYIIEAESVFMESHEQDFADYLWARYNDSQ